MAPSADIHSGQLGSQPPALLRAMTNLISDKSSENIVGAVQRTGSSHFGASAGFSHFQRTSSALAAKATITITSTSTGRTSPRHHLAVLSAPRPETTLGKSPLYATYNSCGNNALAMASKQPRKTYCAQRKYMAQPASMASFRLAAFYNLAGASAWALAAGSTRQFSGLGVDLQMVAPVSSSTDLTAPSSARLSASCRVRAGDST